MKRLESVLVLLTVSGTLCLSHSMTEQRQTLPWRIGPCLVRIDEPCQGDEVAFTYHHGNVSKVLDGYSPDAGTRFDPLLPTKVVIHGYDDQHPNSTVNHILRAYQQKGGYNIIEVEWWKLSSPLICLPSASVNSPHVGKCLAQFLLGLEKTHPGFEPWRVHVIAHSLGAHIAGHASGIIYKARDMRFERITGLDPATPLVTGSGARWNLDARDADFVDVIHTNAGLSGAIDSVGDVDFYPNGGTFQPGCGIDTQCSHIRASTLYAESVLSVTGFWGTECESVVEAVEGECEGQPTEIMGHSCPTDARGVYHLKTASESPFALGNQLNETK